MENVNKTVAAQQITMMFGAMFGVWFAMGYLASLAALTNPAIAMAIMLLKIVSVVALFLAVRYLRNKVFPTNFTWLQSFVYGIQIAAFAGILDAFFVYVYNEWIYPENLQTIWQTSISQLNTQISQLRQMGGGMMKSAVEGLQVAVRQLEEEGCGTPIKTAMGILAQDIQFGFIWMIIFSFFLRRKGYPEEQNA